MNLVFHSTRSPRGGRLRNELKLFIFTIVIQIKNLLPLFLILVATHVKGQAFITTWKTDNLGISASNQITIPTEGTGYNYSIQWEEFGNAAVNGSIPGPITGNQTITFPIAGTYRVSITGAFPRIYFNGHSDPVIDNDFNKILTVEQWGSIAWTSMGHAFQGCANLTIPATDAPNLTQVTDMSYMFWKTDRFNQPIEHWNVSRVTDMSNMFGVSLFNQPIGTWDVGRVTDMSGMFALSNFNQPLGAWDVSSVKSMVNMFAGAVYFNQPIETWDVGRVTVMREMFHFAFNFNQPLGTWNVSNVTDMGYMLDNSGLSISNYDQTLIGWVAKNIKTNVPLGAFGLKYCLGAAAHAQLIAKGWIITGDISLVPTQPVLDIIQAVCHGSTGTITVTVQNSTDIYSFDNGASFQASNIRPSLSPGEYAVIIKNDNGCMSPVQQVVINEPFQQSPTPVLSGSPVVCPNILAVDYRASIDHYTYAWLITGGTLQSQQNNKIKVDWGPNNFSASVKAIGTDQHNCPTDTVTFPVKIQIKLKPLKPLGMDSVCYNFRTGVPYQTSNTNGSVYTWHTNGGIVSEGQTKPLAKIDWADVGQYKLWLKEENTTSTDYCEGFSDTLSVTVFKDLAAITMNFVSTDYKVDKKVQIQWDATLLERISDLIILSRRIAGSNAQWEVIGTLNKNVQSFLDQNVQTDQNIYEYRVEGFNKCDEGLQTIIHNTIKLDGDKDEAQELIDLFWNDYNGWDVVERYEVWRKLDSDTTYRLIDITPGDITNYSGKYGADGFVHVLRIKAKKKNENTISWSNEIELNFENPIDFVPNVITPNGDTKNEYFTIPRLHLYPENYLTIYNSWGEQVYEVRNYKNDWNAAGLLNGTYYYILRLVKNDRIIKGWVQVMR